MKGYRFFQEKETGNCYAVLMDEYNKPMPDTYPDEYLAVIPLSDQANSKCAMGTISQFILGEECTRIRESEARKAHPRLFAYLDNKPATRCFGCGQVYRPGVGHDCPDQADVGLDK